jgi:hypothetical protein
LKLPANVGPLFCPPQPFPFQNNIHLPLASIIGKPECMRKAIDKAAKWLTIINCYLIMQYAARCFMWSFSS